MSAAARIDLARRALADAHRATGLARAPAALDARSSCISTGISSIDEALGGGLARGALYALSGEPGSGRASLALSWLALATRAAREPVAFVDGADALDPCGVSPWLRGRLLWVRARTSLEALACAEQVLDAGGFAMVCLYLVNAGDARASKDPSARLVGPGHWARVAQRAESSRAVALAVCDRDDPRAPGPLSRAAFTAQRGDARWGRSSMLDGVEVELSLARNRRAGAHEGAREAPRARVALEAR